MKKHEDTTQPAAFGAPFERELDLLVAAYEAGEGVQIVACRQRDGLRLWAVRDNTGWVLNKHGEWEHEPLPSSRDNAFLARCRYATPIEARDAHMRYLQA